jgi:hypothetical protein
MYIFPSFFRLDQEGPPFFIRMIMRGGAYKMFAAIFDDQEVAVLDTGDKLDLLIAEFVIQIFDQRITIFSLKIPPIMCDNLSISNR